jgi:hypothetical protein
MTEIKVRKICRLVLSFIAGAACAVAVFFFLLYLFIAIGLVGWSDGGDEELFRRLETTTNISIAFSIIAALFIGTWVVIRINKPKQQL